MNLDQLLLKVDLSPAQILLSFSLAFALAFFWATIYRKTHSGVAYTRSFYLTLILIPPIVAMIMMAIGSNIALSLGLVGSLSVIRFRTVIKDTKDMTFLFMAIAIGLTAGANVWMVGIVGTIIIALIAIVMTKAGHNQVSSADYILIFRSDHKDPWEAMPAAARELIAWRQLRGVTDLGNGLVGDRQAQDFEYTYSVRLAKAASPERVATELSNGVVHQVTMITPENHLEL